jgi:restriction system protein
MQEEASVLLDKMSGFDFEELVADILSRLNAGHIEKILYTQDEGRDIIIHSPSGLIIVECKHHPKGSIGRPVVQKLHSAVITSKAEKGMLVTTGHFTQEALDYAKKLKNDGTIIEMIDYPILIDMATRANVRIVSGKKALSVWTYEIPSDCITDKSICEYVSTLSSSYPRQPSMLLNSRHRAIDYRPIYLVTYDVHSVFQTSVGVVHNEDASKARIALDGDDGSQYDDKIIDFLQDEEQTKFIQPHKDYAGELPTFKMTATELHKTAKRTILEMHTTSVRYSGRNNHSYKKVCVPNDRDIYISDIRQLYMPLANFKFKLNSTTYSIEGVQAPSGSLLPLSDDLKQCRLCKREIENNAVICDVCGQTTHSGGFLIRTIHGFKCKKCGRTTCRNDGHWRRKYLIFKETLCPECTEKAKETGLKMKTFDPLNLDSFWLL